MSERIRRPEYTPPPEALRFREDLEKLKTMENSKERLALALDLYKRLIQDASGEILSALILTYEDEAFYEQERKQGVVQQWEDWWDAGMLSGRDRAYEWVENNDGTRSKKRIEKPTPVSSADIAKSKQSDGYNPIYLIQNAIAEGQTLEGLTDEEQARIPPKNELAELTYLTHDLAYPKRHRGRLRASTDYKGVHEQFGKGKMRPRTIDEFIKNPRALDALFASGFFAIPQSDLPLRDRAFGILLIRRAREIFQDWNNASQAEQNFAKRIKGGLKRTPSEEARGDSPETTRRKNADESSSGSPEGGIVIHDGAHVTFNGPVTIINGNSGEVKIDSNATSGASSEELETENDRLRGEVARLREALATKEAQELPNGNQDQLRPEGGAEDMSEDQGDGDDEAEEVEDTSEDVANATIESYLAAIFPGRNRTHWDELSNTPAKKIQVGNLWWFHGWNNALGKQYKELRRFIHKVHTGWTKDAEKIPIEGDETLEAYLKRALSLRLKRSEEIPDPPKFNFPQREDGNEQVAAEKRERRANKILKQLIAPIPQGTWDKVKTMSATDVRKLLWDDKGGPKKIDLEGANLLTRAIAPLVLGPKGSDPIKLEGDMTLEKFMLDAIKLRLERGEYK